MLMKAFEDFNDVFLEKLQKFIVEIVNEDSHINVIEINENAY